VAGFTSGEGCFNVIVSKSLNTKIGFNVKLRFILSQHIRDELLMENLVTLFGCGNLERTKEGMVYLRVTNFLDISEKIIPFFNRYHIVGVKYQDFLD
jgi:LAGLIDADG endonuclease